MNHLIEISTDKSKLDLTVVVKYLSERAYWSKGRTKEAVIKTIDHSLCFGVYLGGSQIGFARVITDYTTYYFLCDVFIVSEQAGNDYGKSLIEFVVTHPLLKSCRGSLMTSDAHGLYEQYGFKIDTEISKKYMTRATDAVNPPSEETD